MTRTTAFSGLPRIDSHQHFWKVSRGDYHWMTPDMTVLRRDYLPEQLQPDLNREAIGYTVLVQAAPTEAEGEFLLELAQRHAFIAGVVVWLDMEQPDFPERLATWARRPKFVGVRPMIESHPDEAWMLRPTVQAAFQALETSGTCFDFLIQPRHLLPALTVLERFPRLRAVVDHIAKPDIRSGQWHPWCDLMARVAEHRSVYCKLSGMITEADHHLWKPEQLRPYLTQVVSRFSLERVMFGSDWPVCLLAGDYSRVIQALREALGALSPAQEQAVFGGNAAAFYRLKLG
ncbi:MAG: amidohydrolase family protein [Deltaproteobacteria bacterium]|nr:amidohydrolase family protein [Deltaproteobacteria bacterium]